ncbi:MAG: hypothetical protein IH945_07100 [Armatimonadetes bacterium]|nr:hypothetical protein [Armatimonadota bacterium]
MAMITKRFLAALLLVGASVAGYGQEVYIGETELAFARVRMPDGTIQVIHGGKIPYRIERINAKSFEHGRSVGSRASGKDKAQRSKAGGKRGLIGPQPLAPQNATVYQNFILAGQFGSVQFNSSALDDLVLVNGSQGQAWKIVTFGVNLVQRSDKFLVRWQGWDTFTGGQGPGVSAFSGVLFDFGFYLDPVVDFQGTFNGSFVVFVDLTFEPYAIVPNLTCFFAQQFREPHVVGNPPEEDGEGSFVPNVEMVYAANGPQIGSSEDLFYHDNPPDGIYDETEIDTFGEDFPGANFLLAIEIGSGQTLSRTPFSFQWIRGFLQSGNLGSLWDDDGNYNVAKAGLTLFAGEPPAQLIVETFVPTATIDALRFDLVAKVNTPGLSQRIEAFNFSTSQWVVLNEVPATTTDSTVTSVTANPSDFVDPVNLIIRMKVSWYKTGFTLLWPWTVSVDQVHWIITTP